VKLAFVCTALCLATPSPVIAPEHLPAASLVSAADSSVSTAHEEAALEHSAENPDRPINDNASDKSSQQENRKFTKAELCGAVASVATRNGLPVPFLANLIQQESGFKPHVVSRVGAQGIAQFMPRVASSYGLTDPFEPLAALSASGKLLSELVNRFGNVGLAAAAYNAGPKRVQDWIAKRRGLPAETRHYVQSITGRAAEQWVVPGGKDTELILPARARCPGMPTVQRAENELMKSTSERAKTVSLPIREAIVFKTFVRHAMPQPSQFAMGLPVSRFAAMATTPLKKNMQNRQLSGRARLSTAGRDTLMKRFVSMETPTIVVEETLAKHAQSSDRLNSKVRAQRLYVAAAR
jgi:hypothetical protein